MRDGSPKWPRRFPVYKTGAILLTFLCGTLLFSAWLRRALPLERFYLTRYTLLSLFPDLTGIATGAGKKAPAGHSWPVVFVGKNPATDATFAAGSVKPRVRLMSFTQEGFRDWLQQNIYGGRTVAGSVPLAPRRQRLLSALLRCVRHCPRPFPHP